MNNKGQKKLLKRLKNEYLRIMIMGASQSGKTYFLLQTLLKHMNKKYDSVIVFTEEYNRARYKKNFDKYGLKSSFLIGTKDILKNLDIIKKTQSKNIKSYNDEGDPIYHNTILIIFDDILNEKIMKDDDFMSLFTNFRHLQISTILLSQITNKAITTQMKANCNLFILFKLGGQIQRRFPLELIEDTILDNDTFISKDKMKKKAKKIYMDRCMKTKYGYIIIDDCCQLY